MSISLVAPPDCGGPAAEKTDRSGSRSVVTQGGSGSKPVTGPLLLAENEGKARRRLDMFRYVSPVLDQEDSRSAAVFAQFQTSYVRQSACSSAQTENHEYSSGRTLKA